MNEVPLKEHIEKQLAALDKALSLAQEQLNKRLEAMNGVTSRLDAQELRLRSLEGSRSEAEGKARLTAIMWAAVTSVIIGGLVGMMVFALKH